MRTRGGRVRVPREDDRLSTASAPGSDGVPRLFAAAKLRSWFIRSSISVWWSHPRVFLGFSLHESIRRIHQCFNIGTRCLT
jgi:hypothetical protein